MNQVHRNRLLKLATIVESVPACQFDMHLWMRDEENGESCGSVGCALGWAAASSQFRGLTLERNTPVCEGRKGFSAAAIYFGLDYEDTDALFASTSYTANHPQRRIVAKRIRDLVASK